MPLLREETYGTGDQSWLGSTHGIANARTSVLDPTDFTPVDHYPEGFVPSGLPVDASDESSLQPWEGSGDLGFVLFDQRVIGDEPINVPVLRHGLIKVEELPVDFLVPADSVGQFTFIGGESEGS